MSTTVFAQRRAVAKQICHLLQNYGDPEDPTVTTTTEIPQSQSGPWMATVSNLRGYGDTPESAIERLILVAWEQLRDHKERAVKELARCSAALDVANAWTGNVK